MADRKRRTHIRHKRATGGSQSHPQAETDTTISSSDANALGVFADLLAHPQAEDDDERWREAVATLRTCPEGALVDAMLETAIIQPARVALLLITLIPELPHLATLPRRILDRMTALPPNGPAAMSLLCVYSRLFLQGYYLPKSWEQSLVDAGIDAEEYLQFIDQILAATETETTGNGEVPPLPLRKGDPLGKDLVAKIQAMVPAAQLPPMKTAHGAFCVQVKGGIPLGKYLKFLEGVLRTPQEHASTFMASCESKDLPNRVNSSPAKELADRVIQLMDEGLFPRAAATITQLVELEPTNHFIHYVHSRILQECAHLGHSEKDLQNSFQHKFSSLNRAIAIAGPRPNFYYFEDMAVDLEVMGYFAACHVLSLAMLRFVPQSVNLLLSAAFTAYQLGGSFQKYLLAATGFDSARTANFLVEFWAYAPFTSLDRLEDYGLSPDDVVQLDRQVDARIDSALGEESSDDLGEGDKWPAAARRFASESTKEYLGTSAGPEEGADAFYPGGADATIATPEFRRFAQNAQFPRDVLTQVNVFGLYLQRWKEVQWGELTPADATAFFVEWLAATQPSISKNQFNHVMAGVKHFLIFLLEEGTLTQVQYAELEKNLRRKQDIFRDLVREVEEELASNMEEKFPAAIEALCRNVGLRGNPRNTRSYDEWFIARACAWQQFAFFTTICDYFEESDDFDAIVVPFPARRILAWSQAATCKLAEWTIEHPFKLESLETSKLGSWETSEIPSFSKRIATEPDLQVLWVSIIELVPDLPAMDVWDCALHHLLVEFFFFYFNCRECSNHCYQRGEEESPFFAKPPIELPCVSFTWGDVDALFEDVDDEEGDEEEAEDQVENDENDVMEEENGGEGESWYTSIEPAWEASPEYATLPKYTWNYRNDIPGIVISLNFNRNGTLPPTWQWDDVEDTLLFTLPEKVTAPKRYFKAVGRVMQNFCQFLSRELQLTHCAEFAGEIKDIQPKISARADDPANWGMSKSLLQGRRWTGF